MRLHIYAAVCSLFSLSFLLPSVNPFRSSFKTSGMNLYGQMITDISWILFVNWLQLFRTLAALASLLILLCSSFSPKYFQSIWPQYLYYTKAGLSLMATIHANKDVTILWHCSWVFIYVITVFQTNFQRSKLIKTNQLLKVHHTNGISVTAEGGRLLNIHSRF